MQQHHLKNRADDDEAIEPVEERHEVSGEPEAVQFQQSLAREENEEDEIGHVLKRVEPGRLVVVFGSQHARVEKHEDDDKSYILRRLQFQSRRSIRFYLNSEL